MARLREWIARGAPWPDELAGHDPSSEARQHWSFQPVRRPDVPRRTDPWVATPIDGFVLEKLQQRDCEPAPPADSLTLIRRLYLDLLGVPPEPAEIESFRQDRRPDATERLIDRLLADPRYGQRWAQHWLDVVRYADTHGFEVNTPRPNAWPYRDYVIDTFNADVPYDQFVRQQLIGDQLGIDPATGFLVTAAALLPGQIGQDDESKRQARQDELDEIIVGVSGSLLGLTVGCARCHHHKFDPITQQDYYALQAVFAGVQYGERDWESADTQCRVEALSKAFTGKVYAGQFAVPDRTYVLQRGDIRAPRQQVAPDVLKFLGSLQLDEDASDPERRRALADWITDAKNPLTDRVIVNRIWQYHFGTGLVDTPNDLGDAGSRPTHPELLDWLADEFRRSGGSLKHLHRLIVSSSTYRQASDYRPEAALLDSDNRLLWRYPTRRLEAEVIRDSLLKVSGELNTATGGPGFSVFESRGGLDGFPPIERFDADGLRRMVYVHKVRMEPDPVFGAFDCPDAGQSCPKRTRSTTALQALNLLNSRFVHRRAEQFAVRVQSIADESLDQQLDVAFRLALGRSATERERALSRDTVRQFGLPVLCRALFNTNEFLFIP